MRHGGVIWDLFNLPFILRVLNIRTKGNYAQKRNIKFITYRLMAIAGLNVKG